jgi:hypothetical protein
LPVSRYNRILRTLAVFLLILLLSACKSGPDNAAIRQGVLERLEKVGINLTAVDVNLQSVVVKGKEADVTVALTMKSGPPAPPMVMPYKMEQQGDKWVVIGSQGGHAMEGGSPPAASPPGASPHGGGGAMPAPEDLPPSGKKK